MLLRVATPAMAESAEHVALMTKLRESVNVFVKKHEKSEGLKKKKMMI